YSTAAQPVPADVTLRMPLAALPALLGGQVEPHVLDDLGIQLEGDAGALARLVAVLDSPDPDFAIVTP
ncbi:MAG TPA: alkyl sulfatase C-terminal domain-containing protein, partial [Ornithinibacter sp.]|nr:alkyl sulfatase C-terminal domain-containing protein [Ornithinibacter sp.]